MSHQIPDTPGERRDRGLRRVGASTGWLVTVAVAGAAALGITYTQLLPGTTATQQPAPPASPTPAGQRDGQYAPDDDHGEDDHGEDEGDEDEGDEDEGDEDGEGLSGLFLPAQPPASTPQPAQTNTGAS